MKLRNIIRELKDSKWPSKIEALKLTLFTIMVCGIIAIIILGLDLVLFQARDWFLNL